MVEPTCSTYSIVAYDPHTPSWGVAVQSKYLGVGAVVPWARVGTGAIATQSRANPRYGPEGLDLLDDGLAPDEVVARLTDADSDRSWRQVGLVAADGRSAIYTGEKCFPWAGGITGDGYACQGNLLVSEAAVAAMAAAFEQARTQDTGDLAEWLVVALDAAQTAGGDRRGQQSAALLIVRKEGGAWGLDDRAVDLRVDDHPLPIAELHRLLSLHRDMFGPASRQPRVSLHIATRRQTVELLRLIGYLPDTGTTPLAVPDRDLLDALARYAGDEELADHVDVPAGTFAPALLNRLRLRAYVPPSAGAPVARRPGVIGPGGRRQAGRS